MNSLTFEAEPFEISAHSQSGDYSAPAAIEDFEQSEEEFPEPDLTGEMAPRNTDTEAEVAAGTGVRKGCWRSGEDPVPGRRQLTAQHMSKPDYRSRCTR